MDFSALGIKGVQDAVNIIEPNLKIAIIGDPGVGKSWLAASIASNTNQVMDLDFDGRAASLQGKKNVFVKTYVDNNQNNPTAIQTFETDLAALKYAKSQGREIPKTFIIDSITYARKAVEAELIMQQNNLGRVIKIATIHVKIPASYDVINSNRLYLEYIVNELAALGNVIAIFHEADEADRTKSTPNQKSYTGLTTIQPQYLNSILSIFNDTYRLKIRYDGKRVLQTGISNEFIGKSTLKGILPEEVDPDLTKLLEKHRATVAKAINP